MPVVCATELDFEPVDGTSTSQPLGPALRIPAAPAAPGQYSTNLAASPGPWTSQPPHWGPASILHNILALQREKGWKMLVQVSG